MERKMKSTKTDTTPSVLHLTVEIFAIKKEKNLTHSSFPCHVQVLISMMHDFFWKNLKLIKIN